MAKSKSKSKGKRPSTTEGASKKPPTDLADIASFVEEQGLEMDADVANLIADPDLPQLKTKKKDKKRSYIKEDEEEDRDGEEGGEGNGEDEDMTEEDRLELAAYLDMQRGKILEGEEGEEEEEIEEKVYANNVVSEHLIYIIIPILYRMLSSNHDLPDRPPGTPNRHRTRIRTPIHRPPNHHIPNRNPRRPCPSIR